MNTPTTSPYPEFEKRMAFYASSHQHPGNEWIHIFAIPAIMLSLMGLLYELHPYALYALIAISLLYYGYLRHWRYTLAMLLWAAASVGVLSLMGPWRLPLCVGIFVIAWVMQFVGHKMEGKKPSFFEDIQCLLVGPLFVLRTVWRKLSGAA